jgi:hypothetical protein
MCVSASLLAVIAWRLGSKAMRQIALFGSAG